MAHGLFGTFWPLGAPGLEADKLPANRYMKAASGGSATQEIGPVFLVGRGGVGGGRPVMLMLENVNCWFRGFIERWTAGVVS